MNDSTRIRTHRRRILFSLLTVAFGTVLVAAPVLANPPGPATGNNDPFQPTDATPDCDPSTPPAPTLNLNNPTTAAAPVTKSCDPPGTPTQTVTVNWISDTVSGNATDNAWGQGDKSDCFLAKQGGVNGACVTQVFGIGAAKTDLQYHGIGLESRIASDGLLHQYLYSGIKRLQAGGITSSNANYNVEVNQLLAAYKPADPVCLQQGSPTTGGCNIWRSPGDLTFMTDWGGNQSSCNTDTPAICAYVWIDFSTGANKTPSPAGSTCFSAQQAPCWGLLPNGNAALSANPNKAAGSINGDALVQPFTFSEIGVDLTESGLVPPGVCETFKNVWAHSRSSSSFTAELKDFIFGAVELNTCTTTTTLLQQRSAADSDPNATNVGAAAKELNITVGGFVNDTATVGGAGVTGSVNFRLYATKTACEADTAGSGGTNVSTNALSSGSATSSTIQFNTVGDFYWRAFYIPGNLSASASPCDEIVHVGKATPGLITVASGPVTVGATITDTATLSGGFGTLTGTISFQVYGPGDTTCATALTPQPTGKTVNGTGNYTSGPFTTTTVGIYRWRAFYSGDTNNDPVSTPCNDANESSTVGPATPGLITVASGPVTVGATITDTATLSGGFGTLTGTISFQVYGPGDTTCATALTPQPTGKTVNGTGNYTSGPFTTTTVGIYRWRAFYSGDTNNDPVSTPCNDANESSTVGPATPGLITVASGPVTVGATITDTATLSGGFGTLTGTISFQVYGPGDTTCATALTPQPTGKTVNGTGNYTSGPFTTTTVGIYRWRAFYSGDTNNDPVSTPCNDANESSTVGPAETAMDTAPSYIPNDSATLSAPNGGGALAGTIEFKAYTPTAGATALQNCTANGGTGLLFSETKTVAGAATYSTTNTTNSTTAASVYFRVTFTSTNASQKGRNSICAENIAAVLTGDTGGTPGNTP